MKTLYDKGLLIEKEDFETIFEWRIDRWKDNLADLYEAT